MPVLAAFVLGCLSNDDDKVGGFSFLENSGIVIPSTGKAVCAPVFG